MEQDIYQKKDVEEINLMDYLKVVIKGKKIVLGIFILAVLSAFFYNFKAVKVYEINSNLEIGLIKDGAKELLENPDQVVAKIYNDVYGVLIREKLEISEEDYPKIKSENPKDTNLVNIKIESDKPEKAKQILEEINSLVLTEHQKKTEVEKESLEKKIGLLEEDIINVQKDIERIRIKISSLEEEKIVLEDKVTVLQNVLPYEQSPADQFILFDTKEKLEWKKQEIENRYIEINSLETKINILQGQINSLLKDIENIKFTKVVKTPTVSEKPIKPKFLLNIAIASILGLFFGVFLVLFKDFWKRANKLT